MESEVSVGGNDELVLSAWECVPFGVVCGLTSGAARSHE